MASLVFVMVGYGWPSAFDFVMSSLGILIVVGLALLIFARASPKDFDFV